MPSKRLITGILLGLIGLACLLVLLGHIRHRNAVQEQLMGMTLAWQKQLAEPGQLQHSRTHREHLRELVRLEYLQERWFEVPVKLAPEKSKELLEALSKQANSQSTFGWTMGRRPVIKVIAHSEEMPEWETLLSRWNAVSLPVPESPQKSMVQNLTERLGFGATLHIPEQNLFGIEFAGDAPIEFTARVLRIEDRSKLLAKDPNAIPYLVHFRLIKGKIPQFPNHRKFIYTPQHEPGIDSIGRFKLLQEVVFVCSADGPLRGLKNVPSFAELKKAQEKTPVGQMPPQRQPGDNKTPTPTADH